MPSPPQRRLSRSSIDLRDLEQQQYEKVVHTDSAPSIIATEHFNLDGHQEANYIKANLLKEPLALFPPNINCNKIKQPKDTNMLTIDRDNVELVRFIEDNFNYFKKQTGANNDDTDARPPSKRAGLQTGALSDSNFLSYTNNRDPILTSSQDDDDDTKSGKSTKQKRRRTACSDSDFILSNGYTSNIILPLKSKMPFARGSNGVSGKVKNTNNKSQRLKNQLSFTGKSRTGNFFKIHKPSVLSKSYNDSYNKKQDNSEVTTLQRVFSDGNYTNIKNNDSIPSSPDFNTVDMFIKLLECKGSETKLHDNHVNNLNYEVTFNYNEIVSRCDPIILNVATNCLRVKSLCDSTGTSSHNLNNVSTSNSNEQLLLDNHQTASLKQQAQTPPIAGKDDILLLINDNADDSTMVCLQDNFLTNNNGNIAVISPSIIDTENNSESLVDLDVIVPQSLESLKNVPETNLLLLSGATLSNSFDLNVVPLVPVLSPMSSENVQADKLLTITLVEEESEKIMMENNGGVGGAGHSSVVVPNKIDTPTKSYNLSVNNAIAKRSGRVRQSSVVTYDINVINNSEEISPEMVGAGGSAGYAPIGKNCAAITNRRSTSSTSKMQCFPNCFSFYCPQFWFSFCFFFVVPIYNY